jgi:hypothetical protein
MKLIIYACMINLNPGHPLKKCWIYVNPLVIFLSRTGTTNVAGLKLLMGCHEWTYHSSMLWLEFSCMSWSYLCSVIWNTWVTFFCVLNGLLYIVVPSKYTRLKMTVFLLTDNIIIKWVDLETRPVISIYIIVYWFDH